MQQRFKSSIIIMAASAVFTGWVLSYYTRNDRLPNGRLLAGIWFSLLFGSLLLSTLWRRRIPAPVPRTSSELRDQFLSGLSIRWKVLIGLMVVIFLFVAAVARPDQRVPWIVAAAISGGVGVLLFFLEFLAKRWLQRP